MKGKYLNLRSEIIRAGFTCYNVAEAIGISPQALSQKMNGYSLFSAEEIARIGRLLHYFHRASHIKWPALRSPHVYHTK